MRDLIPPGMSGEDFCDHLIDIIGEDHFNQKRQFPDTTERVKKARMFKTAVQAFMEEPKKVYREKVQAFLKSSDLPVPVTDTFQNFTDTTNYDMLWEAAFADVSNRLVNGRVEIVTSSENSVWRLIPEGHAVEVSTGSATLTDFEVSKFGAGIGWTQEMITRRQVGRMMDLAMDFRNRFWQDKADRHYTLLTNGSGNTLGDTGSTTAANITDINTAAFTVLNAVKNTRNLPVSTNLLLYAPVQARSIIDVALGQLSQAYNGSTKLVRYNITPMYTFNSNMPSTATGSVYTCLMVIPGHKIQMAEAMPVTFYNDTDVLSLTFIQTAFSFYGAIVADTNQIATFDLATA